MKNELAGANYLAADLWGLSAGEIVKMIATYGASLLQYFWKSSHHFFVQLQSAFPPSTPPPHEIWPNFQTCPRTSRRNLRCRMNNRWQSTDSPRNTGASSIFRLSDLKAKFGLISNGPDRRLEKKRNMKPKFRF